VNSADTQHAVVAAAEVAGLDFRAVELLVSRLRALAELLCDLVAAVIRAVPAGWSGPGEQAFDAARGRVRAQLEAQAGALQAASLALSALCTSGSSVQAEVTVARRLEVTGVDAPEAISTQLRMAITAFGYADQRAAGLLLDVLAGGPLTGRPKLGLPLSSRAGDLAGGVMAAPAVPAEPAGVALWWAGLPAQTRAAQPAALVGSLDGVPARARDAANRLALAIALHDAERRYADEGFHGLTHALSMIAGSLLPPLLSGPASDLIDRALEPARRRVAALRELADDLAHPGAELIEFDGRGDGRAVVASGDLDASRTVAVVVPGMTTELEDVPRLIDQSATLAHAAGAGAVVVAWLGYDAPSVIQVVHDAKAKTGARDLRRFTAGLRVTAVARQHLTVIGHSYGTLVAGLAAHDAPMADDLVLLASPGVEAASARELDVPAGHVWAARATTDPIQAVFWPGKLLGKLGLPAPYVFGPDPAASTFGATHFAIGGAHGHSGYFTEGSQSLDNLGRIVSGRPTLPTDQQTGEARG
jgi:hypothetical protein